MSVRRLLSDLQMPVVQPPRIVGRCRKYEKLTLVNSFISYLSFTQFHITFADDRAKGECLRIVQQPCVPIEGKCRMSKMDAALPPAVAISEEDVIEAMSSIQGYIDITPGDFKEVYQAALRLAVKRLLTSLKAADLMTRTVHVVGREMSLADAADLLAQKRISGAPVIDRDGRIIGVVSEKDFLREMGFVTTPSFMQIATHCLHDRSCMICRLRNKFVGDIMSRPPITGFPEMTIGEISLLFQTNGINRLPIISEDGRPLGIVTRIDLAHSFNLFAEGTGA